ncbi:MAG: DinB family protein [Salibacteraceae bacterium]
MKIDFIQSQIRSSDRWIDYVLSDLKPEEWELVTAVNSSINWQIGHLILSKYFHGVMSIFPAEHEIHVPFRAHFPLQELQKHYFIKSNPGADWPDRFSTEHLKEDRAMMTQMVSDAVQKLPEAELDQHTSTPNPAAKNKFGALTFVFKHQMWHAGQMAMIKRILRNGPYN